MAGNPNHQQHFEWAKKELEVLEKSKARVISELAEKLEKGGMPVGRIAAEITRQLRGYISSSYVRECLPTKYKQESMGRSKDKEAEANCATSGANSGQSSVLLQTTSDDNSQGGMAPLNAASSTNPDNSTPADVSPDPTCSDSPFVVKLKKQIQELEDRVRPFTAKCELDEENGYSIPLEIHVEPETRDVSANIDRRRARRDF